MRRKNKIRENPTADRKQNGTNKGENGRKSIDEFRAVSQEDLWRIVAKGSVDMWEIGKRGSQK